MSGKSLSSAFGTFSPLRRGEGYPETAVAFSPREGRRCRRRMRGYLLATIILVTSHASAQVLISTPVGVVAAHDGKITLAGRWTTNGPQHPTAIASTTNRVAVLDALANEAVIVDLTTGRATRMQTAETPIAATFQIGRAHV